MRYLLGFLSALTCCISPITAFPAAMTEHMVRAGGTSSLGGPLGGLLGKTLQDIEAAISNLAHPQTRDFIMPNPGFNPATQYVSNQGAHAFVPPNFEAGDQRGPCPGLNAMANHNYLPHSGVATIVDFTTGVYEVFGMGLDIGAFLAAFGAVLTGDTLSWSIGGPAPGLLNILEIDVLNGGNGISNSHNKYESDGSCTRGDLYQYGNDYKFIESQFEELFSLQPNPATANYNMEIISDFRYTRLQQSIANNGDFFYSPFSGLIGQAGGWAFIYRLMANKSAENPEGILNQDVLKSFFSVTGSPGSFVWTEGHERIPNNWYKRAIGDEYTIPFFATDLVNMALRHPEFLVVGGNTGEPNTFTGLDPNDLTRGVYNAATLAQGNNALCFAYQFAQLAAPDQLKSLLTDVTSAVSKLNAAFSAAFGGLGCPKLQGIDTSQLSKYPGAAGAY